MDLDDRNSDGECDDEFLQIAGTNFCGGDEQKRGEKLSQFLSIRNEMVTPLQALEIHSYFIHSEKGFLIG